MWLTLTLTLTSGRALVKLTSFPLDSPEWQPWAQLRPEPPAPPGGEHWLVGLRVGDTVELLHDDMWWEVRIGEMANPHPHPHPIPQPIPNPHPIPNPDACREQVRISEINRARITQDVLFLVRSTQYGDEHEVPAHPNPNPNHQP